MKKVLVDLIAVIIVTVIFVGVVAGAVAVGCWCINISFKLRYAVLVALFILFNYIFPFRTTKSKGK